MRRPLLFLMALLGVVAQAAAYSGLKVRLPLSAATGPVYSPLTGLAVEVTDGWFDGGGYRPIRFRVESASAVTRDRLIEVEARFRLLTRGGSSSATTTARKSFTLAQGAQEAETLLLVPSLGHVTTIDWRVTVDGAEEPRLSTPGPQSLASNQNGPALRVLRPRATGTTQRTIDTGPDRTRRNNWFVVESAGSEAFDDWLAYTSADVAAFTADQLAAWSAEHPEKLAAVRRWLLAGGTVWVEQAGSQAEAYRRIDEALRLDRWRFEATEDERPEEEPPLAPAEPAPGEAADGEEEDEEPSLPTREVVPVEGAPAWSYTRYRPSSDAPGRGPRRSFDAEAFEQLLANGQETRGWFAERAAGFGRVLAFDGGPLDMPEPLRFLAGRRALEEWRTNDWANRHGVEPGGASSAFGNWLIPGVGAAPVTEFEVLITLFVLLVGPLNYWMLWRRQQLQLLVITTPLIAAAATLGLFAYAAVADGFGVKARARSVTLLDQSTGEAVSWSRVTHYAATAPDAPARLPDDTAIYTIEPVWESAIAASTTQRSLAWEEGRQSLTSGWLPTRTTSQHLLVRSRVTEARIGFVGAGETLRVANRLGAPVELLLVRDGAGDWRLAESIDAGASASPKPTTLQAAGQAFRLLSLENMPQFPVGAGQAIERTLERLGETRTVRRQKRSAADVSMDSNLANRALDKLVGLDGSRPLDLPPRSYVAVTKHAVETPLGWDAVQEQGSFHVIVGRW